MKKLLSLLAVVALANPLFAEVETGKPAPDFTLTDSNGTSHSLSDFKGKYVVLEWLNHNCPFVKKHYNSGNMQELQSKYTDKDVVWLSVNSTNESHKDYKDAAATNELNKKHEGAATAVLLDADGTVGKQYGASATPHMFVIDPEGVLIYQGAIDDNPSAKADDAKTANNYVSAALDSAMAGEEVAKAQTKPYGCSVKY